jgi:EAL and modified HD-GYP domain-containing signal transduction protein
MAALDTVAFPLVEVLPVANAQNEWVALWLRAMDQSADTDTLRTVFGTPDLLAASAPLDCVLQIANPAVLTAQVLALLPRTRVVLAVQAAALADEGAAQQLVALQEAGYRVLLDGPAAGGEQPQRHLHSVSSDCALAAPAAGVLPALFGPHLARGVDTTQRFSECENAGFDWFCGAYQLAPQPGTPQQDGTSRRRMLALLGLLARDADSCELEQLLKQDPALSFHLLKLVNSAAFAVSAPITSFNQAITLLGRRQLQRWLQLLLYARQQDNGLPSLLLPLAAMRGAQLEALSKREGGDRDAQDLAFMTGVFSLLDRLFAMPMTEVVGALNVPPYVAAALLRHEGALGVRLGLVEAPPQAHALRAAQIDTASWWQSQMQAYHWAIQVARNV